MSFKISEKVRVIGEGCDKRGKIGKIERDDNGMVCPYVVQFDDDEILAYSADELERVFEVGDRVTVMRTTASFAGDTGTVEMLQKWEGREYLVRFPGGYGSEYEADDLRLADIDVRPALKYGLGDPVALKRDGGRGKIVAVAYDDKPPLFNVQFEDGYSAWFKEDSFMTEDQPTPLFVRVESESLTFGGLEKGFFRLSGWSLHSDSHRMLKTSESEAYCLDCGGFRKIPAEVRVIPLNPSFENTKPEAATVEVGTLKAGDRFEYGAGRLMKHIGFNDSDTILAVENEIPEIVKIKKSQRVIPVEVIETDEIPSEARPIMRCLIWRTDDPCQVVVLRALPTDDEDDDPIVMDFQDIRWLSDSSFNLRNPLSKEEMREVRAAAIDADLRIVNPNVVAAGEVTLRCNM